MVSARMLSRPGHFDLINCRWWYFFVLLLCWVPCVNTWHLLLASFTKRFLRNFFRVVPQICYCEISCCHRVWSCRNQDKCWGLNRRSSICSGWDYWTIIGCALTGKILNSWCRWPPWDSIPWWFLAKHSELSEVVSSWCRWGQVWR